MPYTSLRNNYPLHLRFYASLAFIGLTMCLAFIYGLVAHPLFYLLNRHDLAHYTVSRLWWYITAPVLRIKLNVEGCNNLRGWGGKNTRNYVFVSNHQSELDVLILAQVRSFHGNHRLK